MDDFQRSLFVVWLAVFGGIGVVYFLSVFFLSRRRLRCPACGDNSLRCVQWIRSTALVDGKKVPDNKKYFLCDSCAGRFKHGPDAIFAAASEDEWRRYCAAKW